MRSSKKRPAPQAQGAPRSFSRDLSWLEFNRRVLAQAADEAVPLLERVRFLAIFTSNLDEFFMKRVGILKRQVQMGVDAVGADGRTAQQQLGAIRELVSELAAEQSTIFTSSVLPGLRGAGIEVLRYADLAPDDRAYAVDWYQRHVFPALTPLAVNPTHRFPFISNLSDNIGVLIDPPDSARMPSGVIAPLVLHPSAGKAPEATFARVKVPSNIAYFVKLPQRPGGAAMRYVPVQEVIRGNLGELFPGMNISEQILFRVTRSAGIQKDDLDTANLLQSIEADLKARKFARVVRVEIEQDAEPRMVRVLLDKLNVDPQDVYERSSAIDFAGLGELADIDRPDLRHKQWKPVVPPRLAQLGTNPANFFGQIRKQDLLVHHPYESFNASVERFIAAAASDPDVLTIKQTLYRTTPDSPFIENLVRAAESGKQVACLVELRARFDEGRNVRFARQLEKAGVHVAYGVLGLKTHCKTSLVVRREKGGLRCYAHLGTGNYHPKTAQLYTDVGLLTSDPDITSDLVHLFNYLTGMAAAPQCDTLLVAPFTLRDRVYRMIDREVELAKRGAPARIWAKLNAMEDKEVTERLYAASCAGVKVNLVVRGFCCLIPGVPGMSENIRVSSVVGRFLEHSRIYHFSGGSDDPLEGDWYLSSADWMYRNLSNRVEVACPVRDSAAKARLAEMFSVHEQDSVNAWDLQTDGRYTRRTPGKDAPKASPQALGTFETLMRAAERGHGAA